MYFNNYIFLLVVALVAGCNSSTNNYNDLALFLKEVNSLPTEPIAELIELTTPQEKIYQGMKKRSPFSNPLNYTVINKAKSQVMPDINRTKSELENFDLGAFIMLGHISGNEDHWALVKLNNSNQVHSVTIGDYLGKNHGKITGISDEGIQLTEIITMGRYWVERNSIIELKK